jgi:ketol-acid reductoisomerase
MFLKHTFRKSSLFVRGLKTFTFNGKKEIIYDRDDYPIYNVRQYFKQKKITILNNNNSSQMKITNLMNNGINVITELDKIKQGHIIICDEKLTNLEQLFIPNKTLCFTNILDFNEKKKTIVFPQDIDIIMITPMIHNSMNCRVTVYQDYSKNAFKTVCNLAFALNSSNIYSTTFEKEIYMNLIKKKSVLLGCLQGLFKAHYNVLREMDYTPIEAFNDTVEEITQNLIPTISENGINFTDANVNSTSIEQAIKPIIKELYMNELNKKNVLEMEMWEAGKFVKSLRTNEYHQNNPQLGKRIYITDSDSDE